MATDKYKKILVITTFFTIALIIIGSVVRSTGSGMGCPDWPKCFGYWVPPLTEAELPTNYQEIFQVAGKKIAPFNAFKTWTEYFNRLFGVLVGLLMLFTLIFSYSYKKTKPHIFKGSLTLFILTGFQGWLGSIVVSTDLASYMITIHMFMAMVVLCLLIYLITETFDLKSKGSGELFMPSALLFFLALCQLILGTLSRAKIDQLIKIEDPNRHLWFSAMEPIFDYHTTMAPFLVFVSIFILIKFKELIFETKVIKSLMTLHFIFLASNYISGLIFKYVSFPAWNQPIHLVLASLVIGNLFALVLTTKSEVSDQQIS